MSNTDKKVNPLPLHRLRWINYFADQEGWAIFESDERGLEIEMVDEYAKFPDDDAAIEHVRRLAEAGSKLHELALQIHVDSRRAWVKSKRSKRQA